MPFVFSTGVILLVWLLSTAFFGRTLVPLPVDTGVTLGQMALTVDFWKQIGITVFRGGAALGLTVFIALLTGIPAGLSKKTMDMIAPVVAALQATPPILWITLLMVAVGTGTTVPVMVVVATVFPMLFMNVSHSVAALDPRYFEMARLYRVRRVRVLTDIILPGIYPFVLAGLSYALGTCWKVVAVAEFLGSASGIGARIYWAYRMLDMPELFAWALVLVGMGVGLEYLLIRPLQSLGEAGRRSRA
ncbi:MAG: nitrate ABC transporter permease [Deltaproteobacteria bacterium]|nr:MAG: nitrate ABC transporter permease [Deltaproteobacteria bacterium]